MTIRHDIRKAREDYDQERALISAGDGNAVAFISALAQFHALAPQMADELERVWPKADAYEELREIAGELAELLQMAVEQPLDADEKRDAVKEIARLKEHVGDTGDL